MSGVSCKAAICIQQLAAKCSEINNLIKRKFITDDDLLEDIIKCSEQLNALVDPLIEKIKNSEE